MKKNKREVKDFDPSWGGWQPEAVRDHEIRTILNLSTPMDRLKWLGSMLEGLAKLGAKDKKFNV